MRSGSASSFSSLLFFSTLSHSHLPSVLVRHLSAAVSCSLPIPTSPSLSARLTTERPEDRSLSSTPLDSRPPAGHLYVCRYGTCLFTTNHSSSRRGWKHELEWGARDQTLFASLSAPSSGNATDFGPFLSGLVACAFVQSTTDLVVGARPFLSRGHASPVGHLLLTLAPSGHKISPTFTHHQPPSRPIRLSTRLRLPSTTMFTTLFFIASAAIAQAASIETVSPVDLVRTRSNERPELS